MKSIKEAELKNKKALMRCDFNVPIKNGKISDSSRIKKSLPTIKYLLKEKSSVFIMTHLGRPEGRDKKFSVKPVAEQLKKITKKRVYVIDNILDKKIKKLESTEEGNIYLFENIRFWEEEEENNFNFAKEIAQNFDLYVNDAFSVSHRAHASVDAIARYLPHYAGLSLVEEIEELSKIKNTPHHPFVVIVGGAKVSDKIDVMLNLAKKADYVLAGGAVANTFLLKRGYKIGASRFDEDSLGIVSEIEKKAHTRVMLPTDAVCAASLKAAKTQIVDIHSIPSAICSIPYSIYDIGPKTIIKWEDILRTAKTVFWSGPLGVFEYSKFAHGTKKIARAISKVTSEGQETIVGGGDTIVCLNQFKIKKFTHISTAGSAMLQFVGGKNLPGIEALERK